jgi:hypothetical protein
MQDAPAGGAAVAAISRWHLACTSVHPGQPMDFVLVAVTVVFFAISVAYVRGCDRL